jgi:hypothetical protein
VAICAATAQPALANDRAGRSSSSLTKQVELRNLAMSTAIEQFAAWVTRARDHQRLPFIIVDKRKAIASAFDASGRHLRTTPVLLGTGVGDTFAPGVAEIDMHKTAPWQRITPAGRFFAEEDLDLEGETVLWVDYDMSIAIHKLPAKRTKQRRHERIRSANPADHRITYGCINVLSDFYQNVVHPNFRSKGGIVYVLPDTMPLKSVFKSYDAAIASSVTRVQQSVTEVPAATQRF